HQGLLERIGIAAKYLAPLFRNSVGKHMMRKGFSKEVSDVVSEASVRDPKLLSRVISEEEYGLREESLSNPRTAGVYSGLANMLGASFPLLPYFLGLPIPFAIPLSLVIVSVCLAATGFIVAVSADMPIKRKIAEMVSVGLCAAGASFIVGRLASVFLGSRTEL
ncbi:MAG: VIT1/CCC1 transporter family protein, partial [Candidatus Bathyarchaeia archaeon]